MANTIEHTDLTTNSFVNSTSRYVDSSVLYYGDLRRLTFSTYKRGTYPDNSEDLFTVIPAGMEYRPDKMSELAYGTPDFWWKIMEANRIADIFNFKAGVNLRIPANPF